MASLPISLGDRGLLHCSLWLWSLVIAGNYSGFPPAATHCRPSLVLSANDNGLRKLPCAPVMWATDLSPAAKLKKLDSIFSKSSLWQAFSSSILCKLSSQDETALVETALRVTLIQVLELIQCNTIIEIVGSCRRTVSFHSSSWSHFSSVFALLFRPALLEMSRQASSDAISSCQWLFAIACLHTLPELSVATMMTPNPVLRGSIHLASVKAMIYRLQRYLIAASLIDFYSLLPSHNFLHYPCQSVLVLIKLK